MELQVGSGRASGGRAHDPLAVAVANASLLGVGYLMLGRRRLAVGTGLTTLLLLTLLVLLARSVWFEVVVLLWWAALIAHGWWLAGGRTRRVVVRAQRVIALAVTVPVLLAVGVLRFDAAGIERTLVEARDRGDCARATAAMDGVWVGHRVADAPLIARGDDTVTACRALQVAQGDLTTALSGDVYALKTGLLGLGTVLGQLPGHERMVDVVLDGFLGGLPTAAPCDAVVITDWLAERQPTHNTLDRSAGAAARTAPAALVGCGDERLAGNDGKAALKRYQQLLDQYPGHELTARAQDGVRQATLAAELANVRNLRGQYCSTPAPYGGAPPYGGGVNRALLYGNEYTEKLPAEWKAGDAAEAVLVVCTGEKGSGAVVRTCSYTHGLGETTEVRYRKIAIPVKAYELRTARLVVDTTVEIGGTSCPESISYTTYGYGLTDSGPPDQLVTPSDADVHAAFRTLISP